MAAVPLNGRSYNTTYSEGSLSRSFALGGTSPSASSGTGDMSLNLVLDPALPIPSASAPTTADASLYRYVIMARVPACNHMVSV